MRLPWLQVLPPIPYAWWVSHLSISRRSLRECTRSYFSKMAVKLPPAPHSLSHNARLPHLHEEAELISLPLDLSGLWLFWLTEFGRKWYSVTFGAESWKVMQPLPCSRDDAQPCKKSNYPEAATLWEAQDEWKGPGECSDLQPRSSSHRSQGTRHGSEGISRLLHPNLFSHASLWVFSAELPHVMQQRQAISFVPCLKFWPRESVSTIKEVVVLSHYILG